MEWWGKKFNQNGVFNINITHRALSLLTVAKKANPQKSPQSLYLSALLTFYCILRPRNRHLLIVFGLFNTFPKNLKRIHLHWTLETSRHHNILVGRDCAFASWQGRDVLSLARGWACRLIFAVYWCAQSASPWCGSQQFLGSGTWNRQKETWAFHAVTVLPHLLLTVPDFNDYRSFHCIRVSRRAVIHCLTHTGTRI